MNNSVRERLKKDRYMKNKIHVVQEIIQGVAETPRVFTDVRKANKHYIGLVNEVHDQNFKGIKETLRFMREAEHEDEEIMYWTTETE